MTIQELVERLFSEDPDAVICIENSMGEYIEIQDYESYKGVSYENEEGLQKGNIIVI